MRRALFPALVACLVMTAAARAQQIDPKKVREIAGSAEFLRDVPKHFATLKAVDPARRQVSLLIEGEVLTKAWPLAADAELKVMGWWGRLEQFKVGDRVWAWFKTDRKKQPVAISMLADEMSEQDIHGDGATVKLWKEGDLVIKSASGADRRFTADEDRMRPLKWKWGDKLYVQTAGAKVTRVLSAEGFERARGEQKAWLRKVWEKEGLPGSVAFAHTFSGEMDLILDHEAMRWARSLSVGDKVTLKADPPIKALVKNVQPWRERTQLRLVVYSFDLADLAPGQRVSLLRPAPPLEVDTAQLPPDLDRPRAKPERIDWFLASVYCTCGVAGDRCTGHFYSLASCNPNGCGMPNSMRRVLGKLIDQGLTDRQIFEELLKDHGPTLLRPHLLP